MTLDASQRAEFLSMMQGEEPACVVHAYEYIFLGADLDMRIAMPSVQRGISGSPMSHGAPSGQVPTVTPLRMSPDRQPCQKASCAKSSLSPAAIASAFIRSIATSLSLRRGHPRFRSHVLGSSSSSVSSMHNLPGGRKSSGGGS